MTVNAMDRSELILIQMPMEWKYPDPGIYAVIAVRRTFKAVVNARTLLTMSSMRLLNLDRRTITSTRQRPEPRPICCLHNEITEAI